MTKTWTEDENYDKFTDICKGKGLKYGTVINKLIKTFVSDSTIREEVLSK